MTPRDNPKKDAEGRTDVADSVHHFFDNIFHPTSYSKTETGPTTTTTNDDFIAAALNDVVDEDDKVGMENVVQENAVLPPPSPASAAVMEQEPTEQVEEPKGGAAATVTAATVVPAPVAAATTGAGRTLDASKVYTGRTRWFDRRKGYGFVDLVDDETGGVVSPDDASNNVNGIFVHQTDIASDDPTLFRCLQTNEVVRFGVVRRDGDGNGNGDTRWKATHVVGRDGNFVSSVLQQKRKRKNNKDGTNQ
jgi:cold shock CspA family protein